MSTAEENQPACCISFPPWYILMPTVRWRLARASESLVGGPSAPDSALPHPLCSLWLLPSPPGGGARRPCHSIHRTRSLGLLTISAEGRSLSPLPAERVTRYKITTRRRVHRLPWSTVSRVFHLSFPLFVYTLCGLPALGFNKWMQRLCGLRKYERRTCN